MKKLILSLLALGVGTAIQAQILDSLRLGAQSVQYEIIAPSNYEDFSATPYGDQLLFVSSRETSLFSKKYDYNNQKFFDLFLYDFKSKEVSRYGDQLASLESSKFHLGPSILLPDSAGIVLSRNYKMPNLDDEVNFYLVYENWKTGERYTMPYCTMANSFQHPFYDAKTRRLFFSANLPGGPGGYDIYYSEFLKDGTWGDPIIVQGVNGPSDDVFPTISKDGKLYFSRTETQMGLDVFVFDMETQLLQSCKAPFITSRDEFSLVALNKDSAVFSQSQNGRFNTDLVLAWVETDGKEIIENFAVIAPVPADTNPWDYLEEVKSKWPEDEVWVGVQDGQPVVMIKGSRPQNEADDVKNAVIASGIPAELTKDPVAPLERRVERLNVVYPIVCGLEDCFDQLDQWKSTTQTDSLWLGELNGRPVIVVSTKQVKSKAEVSKDWAVSEGMAIAYLTPEFPTPLERPAAETRYFSNIAGVFNDPSGAQKQLATVQEWAPNAFISLYKGKYYVVSADYEPGQQALQSKAYAVENGVAGAWLLPEKLYPIVLPNLSGAPDLIVYFKFDKYDVMDKYQQQIDDVIAKLPTGINRVYMVGHTDSRGTNAYNEVLSKNRVNEVAKYMADSHPSFNAIKELDSKGETQLTNDCGDSIDCDPYAHFLNRRVEVWFY